MSDNNKFSNDTEYVEIIDNANCSFTTIMNYIFDDKNISFKAQGIYCQIMRYKNTGKNKIYIKSLVTQKTDGKAAVAAGIKELIEHGYITKEYMRNEKGQIKGVKYQIYTMPLTENRLSEISKAENRLSENGLSEISKSDTYKENNNKKKISSNENNNIKKTDPIDDIFKEYAQGELYNTLVDYRKMRKEIKSPMTERAVTLLLKKLDEYANGDFEKIQLLNESIINNWKSVYPPKEKKTYTGYNQPKNTQADMEKFMNTDMSYLDNGGSWL